MSRPSEAIASTAKLQLPRRGSWAGARGFHADDPKPLCTVLGSAPGVSVRIPHPKPHRSTFNDAEIAAEREVAA